MKIKITKTKEYNIPDKDTCTYLDKKGLIRECEALKKSIWVDSDTSITEDVFRCKVFDKQIMGTKTVGTYRFPVKLEECNKKGNQNV